MRPNRTINHISRTNELYIVAFSMVVWQHNTPINSSILRMTSNAMIVVDVLGFHAFVAGTIFPKVIARA